LSVIKDSYTCIVFNNQLKMANGGTTFKY